LHVRSRDRQAIWYPARVAGASYPACRRCDALPGSVGRFNLRHAPTTRLDRGAITGRHGALELAGMAPSNEGLAEVYRCTECGRQWSLLTWYSAGCFDLRGHAPCPSCGERLEIVAEQVAWGEVRLRCLSCDARFSLETAGDPPGVPHAVRAPGSP
jgi:hypothetical protein